MLLLAALIIFLNGCGAGSGAPSVSSQAPGNDTQRALDLATAQKVYDGVPRTPPGFYSDPQPPGVVSTVATVHLKNSDVAGNGSTPFELCSDDLSQTTAWSELKSTFMGSYADLVEVDGNTRYWQLTRVPRADPNARLRHRVFKCSYVNRDANNPALDSGPAGVMNSRPLDAAGLQSLAEYLWYFTSFNNADHVVLDSQPMSAAAGSLAHAIGMARLVRATVNGSCDRVEQIRWTHTLNAANGDMQRTMELVRSFGARRVNGVVELCSG